MDKKIDATVNELKGQLKDVSKRTQNLEEGMKKTRVEMREMKKDEERIWAGMSEINKTQEEVWDAISMNELRQREVNLRLRLVPELQGENIKEKLIKEIAQWMEMDIEEVTKSVQSAFRLKTRSAKARKLPGDCLVTFKDREMRNQILQKNREKRLNIEGNYIIIFKDISIRLLKRRDPYKPTVQILEKNNIELRWEYPEGISFVYKSKRHRLTSLEELGKFLRKYKEQNFTKM
uniref:L1 transposable element RRM domain-containing protein n=1 Tax=Podarcis muralis TaxID=64176 RepID=A0A670IGT0_PODMU